MVDLTLVSFVRTATGNFEVLRWLYEKPDSQLAQQKLWMTLQQSAIWTSPNGCTHKLDFAARRMRCDRASPELKREMKQRDTYLGRMAIEKNNWEKVKWAFEQGFGGVSYGYDEMFCSQWETQKKILRYVLNNSDNRLQQRAVAAALNEAAVDGDVEFFAWVVKNYLTINDGTIDALMMSTCRVCEYGHISIVKWMLSFMSSRHIAYDLSEAMFAAAREGKVEIARWLYTTFCHSRNIHLFNEQDVSTQRTGPTPNKAMDVAGGNGYLNVLLFSCWASERSSVPAQPQRRIEAKRQARQSVSNAPHAMDTAAANGHLDIVCNGYTLIARMDA